VPPMRCSRATTLATLVAVTLAGCDGGGTAVESDPAGALAEAVEALGEYDGIELIVGLDGDEDVLATAAESDLDDDIQLLLGSRIVLRATGRDAADAEGEVIVELRGGPVAELRSLPGGQLFVRLDPEAAADAVGDADLAETLEDAVGTAEELGLGDLAAAVRSGAWIHLTGLDGFADATGAGTDGPAEAEATDVRRRLTRSLQRFLDQDVQVSHRGEEDAGERLTATTTRADLARLLGEVTSVVGDLGGLAGEALELDPDEVGDDPVELDVWLDRGRLSQVGFDLSNLAEDGEGAPEGTYLAVRVEEFDGTVDAPDAATDIDLRAILGQLLGGGLGGAPGAGADGRAATADGADQTDLGDPLGGGCIPPDELDTLTGGDPEAEAEVDAAIDAGLVAVC
jgi:hypothetical protein